MPLVVCVLSLALAVIVTATLVRPALVMPVLVMQAPATLPVTELTLAMPVLVEDMP